MPPKRKAKAVVKPYVKRFKSASKPIMKKGETAHMYKEVDSYQRNQERRIILIGKTGTGKSTLGNAMLGEKCFETEGVQMQSITKHCQVRHKNSKDGKDIVILDTPGLKDTKLEKAKIIEELCKCTAMMAPGPHAICLVIRGDDRFTQENIDTLNEFCTFFGEEIYKYVIVVFTHKASMGKSTTTEDCLCALPPEFLTMLLKFGGKKIAIESRAEKKLLEKQIDELFKLIEEIIERNGGGYYSEEKFKEAEEAFRKRIPKIQQDVEKRFEPKKRSLEDENQEKVKKFEEQEKKRKKKLQKLKKKLEKEKQSKQKEKLKKDARTANEKRSKATLKKKIKSLEKKLEKERKEKEETKEKYHRDMEEIRREQVQAFHAIMREDRRRTREEVMESTSFGGALMNVVEKGRLVFSNAQGFIGNVIGTIQSVLQR